MPGFRENRCEVHEKTADAVKIYMKKYVISPLPGNRRRADFHSELNRFSLKQGIINCHFFELL
jgi:hypothetical protein